MFVLIIGTIFIFNNTNTFSQVIYQNTYYFNFGSRKIKIYDNGKIYEDLEIEQVNHKTNYKLIKTLNKEELDDLKNKLNNSNDEIELENYIKQLIYGKLNLDM